MKLLTSKATVDAPEPGRRERQRLEREARMAEAMAAAEARAARARSITLVQRIEQAQEKLDRPLARARELLGDLSTTELQVYLLAEELGQNRKGVLQGYPKAGADLRHRYESELAATRPAD